MAFLRLTRDPRGYENTILLHAAHPGERPRVLYWYRSAPGVRVGRPPLDEDAIRLIEERHPEIEFDWADILEAGTMMAPEVERRPERLRRKPPRLHEESSASPVTPPVTVEPAQEETADIETVAPIDREPSPASLALLDELVGREIAARLRGRYLDIMARIHRAADHPDRQSWQARADVLDPDRWATPERVMHGLQDADWKFEELKREIDDKTSLS